MTPKYHKGCGMRSTGLRMALLGILIGLFLTGCGTTKYVVEYRVPEEFAQPCPIPAIRSRTNGELADSLKRMEHALVLCNIDKASIRALPKPE